jgi:hypothetical protein
VRQLLEGNRDIVSSRLAKMEAEAAMARAKTAVIEKAYLRRDKLALALTNGYQYMRKVIERAGLPEASRVALLRALGAGPEALLEGIGPDEPAGNGLGAARPRGKRGKQRVSRTTENDNGRAHHHTGTTL